MRRIESLDEYKSLTASKGGWVGNIYWLADDLKRYIEAGMLYSLPASEGAALALRDENRTQFCFRTDRSRATRFCCDLDANGPWVAELICPAQAPERCDREREVLDRLGFEKRFEVCMMIARGLSGDRLDPGFGGCLARPACAGDASAVEALYRRALDPVTDNPPRGDALICQIETGNLWVLAAPDGSVRGCVTLESEGQSAWFRHLVVDEAFRGQGLGRALLWQTGKTLPRESELKLWVKTNNAPAIHVYRSLGFETNRRKLEIWTR